MLLGIFAHIINFNCERDLILISISSEKHLVNLCPASQFSVYTVLQISANQVSTIVLINNTH